MHYAISVPNFGEYADPRLTADLAREAEAAGWQGFFVWDHVHAAYAPGLPLADPWALLTAIALATERVRLGPMVTPLARRRPWTLARQAVTLDRLCGGRLTLGVGLGAPPELEFAAFGEDADARARAAKLDEGLEVLTGLWTGEPFSFTGEHYRLTDVQFLPTPAQRPRIPVWVAQSWPHRRPLLRAARWDGLVPMHEATVSPTPSQLAEALAVVREHRDPAEPFDVAVPVVLDGDRAGAVERAGEYEAVGATWLLVGAWGIDELRTQIGSGPPRR